MSPSGRPATADPPGDLLYFYLSYACLGPLPSDPPRDAPRAAGTARQPAPSGHRAEPNREVQKFYNDLDSAIVARTGRRPPAGFYDRHVPFDADPRKTHAAALGRAQVFVALYSPDYLTMSWPQLEQIAFRDRVARQRLDPDTRILPVLWTPVPSWTVEAAEHLRLLDQAATLVREAPDYRDNGLRAMCCLQETYQPYQQPYRQVLDRIASRIIRVIETGPALPTVTLDFERIPSASTADPSLIITVLAVGPELAAEPAWHPYTGRQELPVAAYVGREAERRGLAPRVVALERFRSESTGNPALAVVDPRILRQPDGEPRLREVFQELPIWVRPLVAGDSGDVTLDALTARAQQILSESVPADSHPPVRTVERVDGPEDFRAKLPLVLEKTRRAYLTFGTYHLPPSSTPRLRLTGGGDEPANGQDSDANQ